MDTLLSSLSPIAHSANLLIIIHTYLPLKPILMGFDIRKVRHLILDLYSSKELIDRKDLCEEVITH
ncbi:hypothetical protein HMPREF3027_01635 [Porphyromonas sp. HMSC077F02]|nr:hypothetical protein HMPREF3027_01635 [Porphyromonas sp. HMSC077F02]